MKNNLRYLTRRDFIKNIAYCSAASTLMCSCTSMVNTLIPIMIGIKENPPPGTTPMEPVVSSINSNVTIVTHNQAVNSKGVINEEAVHKMLEEGMKSLIGKSSLEECWLAIFPDLKKSDVIGIKINAIDPHLPSHPELVNAIVENLIKIGVVENNIIVWDRFTDAPIEGLVKCGYVINSSDRGVKYMATHMKEVGYDDNVKVQIPSKNIAFPISKIISQYCNYLINVPVVKGGGYCGVSGGMKNYYGAIPLGDRMFTKGIRKMHAHCANPQIAQLYNNPIIRDKNKLTICDALLGVYDGKIYGPPQFINNQLIISTDPVAVDYYALMIIERERAKRNLPSILRNAKYIQSAAEMGLGTNNPEQMDVRQIELG